MMSASPRTVAVSHCIFKETGLSRSSTLQNFLFRRSRAPSWLSDTMQWMWWRLVQLHWPLFGYFLRLSNNDCTLGSSERTRWMVWWKGRRCKFEGDMAWPKVCRSFILLGHWNRNSADSIMSKLWRHFNHWRNLQCRSSWKFFERSCSNLLQWMSAKSCSYSTLHEGEPS